MEGYKYQLRRDAVSQSAVDSQADATVAAVDEEALMLCHGDLERERAAESLVAVDMGTRDFATAFRGGTGHF